MPLMGPSLYISSYIHVFLDGRIGKYIYIYSLLLRTCLYINILYYILLYIFFFNKNIYLFFFFLINLFLRSVSPSFTLECEAGTANRIVRATHT